MHKTDLQNLALIRLREAKVLLGNEEWSGAYYLGGYAIELALKAVLVTQFCANTLPDKQLVTRAYTHELEGLLRLATLEAKLEAEVNSDPDFGVNWSLTKDWSEQSRYRVTSEQKAEELLEAIADPVHGVLRWVQQEW